MSIRRFIFLFLITSLNAICQTKDTTYSLTSEFGAGYSHYLTTMDYDELNQNGFSGTIRVMWNPEHLLSIGLETGYHYLYSIEVSNIETEFGTSDFSASMAAVPIFIVIQMRITPNIKLNAGSGMFLLHNSGTAFGDELSSSQLSIGAHGGVAYIYPLNELISIGGELQYSYYSKIQDQSLSLQFIFIYKFLEW